MKTFVGTKPEILLTVPFFLIIIFSRCTPVETNSLEVTATAYNSLPGQTHPDHPSIGAWGDTLRPGIKSIAVSVDLIDSGLVRNTKVEIEGLAGKYIVLDKMHHRWQKRIDIHMGKNADAAMKWGVQNVTIKWKAEK